MAGRFVGLLVSVCLGIVVAGSSTSPPLLQQLEQDLKEGAEWIRIPSKAGEWIWTHRSSIIALLKHRQSHLQLADVEFTLYTRTADGDHEGRRLELGAADSLAASSFRPEHPTRVIVHGWLNSGRSPFAESTRDAYLLQWNYNVIVVDWSACAGLWNYVWAVRCVPVVGQALALLLDELQRERGLRMDSVYLIGHSLGAHIAGIAGKLSQHDRPHTIVALDPALPLFSLLAAEHRIDSRDARYVEVMHTNGGLLGFLCPLGTADFYPNGGIRQPGCILDVAGVCSHSRAWELYVESLLEPPEKLLASSSLAERVKMGGEPSSAGRARGIYFIDTRDRSPFFDR